MADKILFPNTVDVVRLINNDIVDNALGQRSSYILLPSLYERAYALVHETGEYPLTQNIIAPDESLTKARESVINILTNRT